MTEDGPIVRLDESCCEDCTKTAWKYQNGSDYFTGALAIGLMLFDVGIHK